MKPFAILSFAVVATAALAGPYDQPYAVIATEKSPSADPNLRTPIVNRIDDETVMTSTYGPFLSYAAVAPGPHKVTLDLRPRKGFKLATQNTFDLETRPCVRYIVAAELKSPTLQEWTPVVRREERIGECEAKFKIAGAK